MIPKIIHYCWFGGAPLPMLAEKCIASWKKYCPDYEIIEWNEDNYPLKNTPDYVKEAIEAKRWAFATDYIRLDIIYKHGGIYFDTDVELIRAIDDELLDCEAFFARGNMGDIATGLGFGSVKQCECVRLLRDDYNGVHFKLGPVTYDTKPCNQRNKKIFDHYGFSDNVKNIETINGIVVYPEEYFSPIDLNSDETYFTENTYSIHHYLLSWRTPRERRSNKRRKCLVKIFGNRIGNCFSDVLNQSIRRMYKIVDYFKIIIGKV